jgi:glycosyltransferase involved in cell wall biosynthesis
MAALITVLIPTLNAEEFLAEALASLSGQTFRDFRILVLDGGSQDRTRQIALSHRGVEFVECGSVGLGAQLRIGLERAETPLVARMDADDVALPHRFESQMEALQDREITIVGGQIDLLVGSRICRAQPLPRTHAQIRRALLAGFPAFCHAAVMFRTDPARQRRAYSIPGLGEDLDFFLRMTEAGRALNLPTVLYRYRLHDRSACFRSFDEVCRNYAFALACADARRNGRPEPDAAQHAESWMKRGWAARLSTKAECFAVRLYRRSRIKIAKGHSVRGLAGAAVSVALRPRLIQTRARIALAALAGGGSE